MKKVLCLIFFLGLVSLVNADIVRNADQVLNSSFIEKSTTTGMPSSIRVTISTGSTSSMSISNFTSSTTLTNASLITFDNLTSTVSKIMANESNGITFFYSSMTVNNISILSEGGCNSVLISNVGNINSIPDGMPDNITLPKAVVNPVFTWTLTAGTTLHIQVVGGK